MLLQTVQNFDVLDNIFNCSFIYIQKEKTLRCKNLPGEQISYSDIGKLKYENTELAIQPEFACSKLTKETLEQSVKYVQS